MNTIMNTMMSKSLRLAALLMLAGGLIACSENEDTLKVGGKNFGESRILAEMVAALAEKSGIPVTRRIGLGDTLANLEALKRGDIDVYPEYNGTGLVMLGQPALADGDAAMARVKELYEPLDLSWTDRLGFANNYGLAMRRDRAEELEIQTISDLIGKAGDLQIGVDEDFETRPLDGLDALTSRYGMNFGSTDVVSAENRPELYDKLLAGTADVIEVYTTDGQIADYDLLVLQDDLGFFPVYEAAPLVRADALVRFPALREALGSLAGQLDDVTMQRLNQRVDQEGLAPRAVARAALAELELLDSAQALDPSEPLTIATSPFAATEEETGLALRALRNAIPGRRIVAEDSADPLAAIIGGEARLGLVAASEFVDIDDNGATSMRPFEALGVVGQSLVHLVLLKDQIEGIDALGKIAVSGEGSASTRTLQIINAGLETTFEPVILKAGETETFLSEARASDADAALLLAPSGSPAIADLIEGGGRIISLEGWEDGNNLVRYPFLRQARIAAGTYPGQDEAIETLSSQLVLAGPATVAAASAIGDQGPGSTASTNAVPLAEDTVTALAGALGQQSGIDPTLPQAPVLAPTLPEPPLTVNPAPDVSFLSVIIIAMFIWLIWLYGRPERR